MELAQELFLTAVFAVLFSLVIAKLVSVATSGSVSLDRGKVGGRGGDAVAGGLGGPFVEELRFGKEKLRAPSVGSERRVVKALEEELRMVDRLGDEMVVVEKVVFEPSVCGEEAGLEGGEAVDEVGIMELQEKGDSGKEEVLADDEETEGNGDESLQEANRLRDVEVRFPVVEAGEAAGVVSEGEEKEEKDKEIVDEDDWEGIERSELEKDFSAATRFVDDRKDRLGAAMGDEAKMHLHGLRKVATEGPCRNPPPMAMNVAARAKWNAWQRLGNMSPDLAMEQYLNLLSESVPNWSEEKSAEIDESDVITSQQQDSPLGAVSGHQAESVGVRETSVAAEVILDDPGHEANSVGKAKE